MNTAERKLNIIQQIILLNDDETISNLESWIIENIALPDHKDQVVLTDIGKQELLDRMSQYEEQPVSQKSWRIILEEVKAKYGL